MPRRLRVAFEAQQFLTLQADKGTFARTGIAAGFTYVPVSVSADVWTKISTVLSAGDTRSGPNFNQGWARVAMNTNTGMPWAFQHNPSQGSYGGNWYFDSNVGYWQRTNAIFGDWHRDPLSLWENYDLTYAPDLNKFYRTTGVPVGGVSGPFGGDCIYNVATDEWSNPYPDSYATYVPLVPYDDGYYGTKGNTMGVADNAVKYYNGHVYQFGGLSVGTGQGLRRRNLSTGVIEYLLSWTVGPPWDGVNRSAIYRRAGFDSRTKQLYVLANDIEYWSCDLTQASLTWEYKAATGSVGGPPPLAYPGYTQGDFGMLAVIDEAANCMVAWTGYVATVGADGLQSLRKTWVMDLATRVWRDGPSFDAGDTVPPASVAVQADMIYDPVGRRTILTVGRGSVGTEVWELQIAPVGGKITSWKLPTSTGSTYGQNYYGFPFTANGGSKHVNMAYCPADGRLYATGGDTIHSATDGLWSMSLDDGSWRLDVGQPVYGTTVAPHAYQDGCLFEWMPSRNKFLFGFGGVFGYEAPGSEIYNYSSGYWMYDPIAGSWEQVAAFFSNPTLSSSVNGTGNEFGGVYDADTDTVYVLGEGVTVALGCKRYNIGTGVQDSTISFTVPSSGVSGYTQAVFGRGRQCQIGRYIYAIGYYSNGVGYIPGLWRYGIDDHTFVKLAQPPAFTESVQDEELTLVQSNGKLLHPRRNGPEGNMPEGIHVYNPANDSWTTDTKTPAYGAWIQNSTCALPDGRVAMSGGSFGSQQTHMWFYEAT